MKDAKILEKNQSGLTSSTADNSHDKMTGYSLELGFLKQSSPEDKLIAAETCMSNGKFFLRHQFFQNNREHPRLSKELELKEAHNILSKAVGCSVQEKSFKCAQKKTLENIASNESSESELSDSDDKLHKAFNIDPVLTMIPKIKKYSSLKENFHSQDLKTNLNLKDEQKLKLPKVNNFTKKVTKKSSLRVESEVWFKADTEKYHDNFPLPLEKQNTDYPEYFSPIHDSQKKYNSSLSCSSAQFLSLADFPSINMINSPTHAKKVRSQVTSYENHIDLNRINEIGKKALYVKNIPNKYTKKMILKLFDRDFKNTYDFFYLPIDFNNNCNIGFAFIKFIDVKHVKRFCEKYGNKKWPHFNSEKICEIRYARMQKAEEMIDHFKNSSLWRKADSSCLPFISSTNRSVTS